MAVFMIRLVGGVDWATLEILAPLGLAANGAQDVRYNPMDCLIC